MSLQKIYKVKEALLKVMRNVGHYEVLNKAEQYIVWAEDGEGDSLEANSRKGIQVIQGTVDYFTKLEKDENADKIQEELGKAGICFRLESIQYEEETGYIHYEWIWEVS